jgi:hypothetical protein
LKINKKVVLNKNVGGNFFFKPIKMFSNKSVGGIFLLILNNPVYFSTLFCPFSTKSILRLHGCFSKVSKNSVSRGSPGIHWSNSWLDKSALPDFFQCKK